MMTKIVPPFSIFNIDLKMRSVSETGRYLVEVKVEIEIEIHSALVEPLHRVRGIVLIVDVLPTESTVGNGSSRDKNHRRRSHPSSPSP